VSSDAKKNCIVESLVTNKDDLIDGCGSYYEIMDVIVRRNYSELFY
jgi:hypothetical protein